VGGLGMAKKNQKGRRRNAQRNGKERIRIRKKTRRRDSSLE